MKKLLITYQYKADENTTCENCASITVSDKIFDEVDTQSRVSFETTEKLDRLCRALVSLEGGIESTVRVAMIEAEQ